MPIEFSLKSFVSRKFSQFCKDERESDLLPGESDSSKPFYPMPIVVNDDLYFLEEIHLDFLLLSYFAGKPNTMIPFTRINSVVFPVSIL